MSEARSFHGGPLGLMDRFGAPQVEDAAPQPGADRIEMALWQRGPVFAEIGVEHGQLADFLGRGHGCDQVFDARGGGGVGHLGSCFGAGRPFERFDEL